MCPIPTHLGDHNMFVSYMFFKDDGMSTYPHKEGRWVCETCTGLTKLLRGVMDLGYVAVHVDSIVRHERG